MNVKIIYKSNIKSFCYNLERRFITNANEYLEDIYSELFTEMEEISGGIYNLFGEAVAKGKNVESLKATIIMVTFIFHLVVIVYFLVLDMAFFANILAHYADE